MDHVMGDVEDATLALDDLRSQFALLEEGKRRKEQTDQVQTTG